MSMKLPGPLLSPRRVTFPEDSREDSSRNHGDAEETASSGLELLWILGTVPHQAPSKASPEQQDRGPRRSLGARQRWEPPALSGHPVTTPRSPSRSSSTHGGYRRPRCLSRGAPPRLADCPPRSPRPASAPQPCQAAMHFASPRSCPTTPEFRNSARARPRRSSSAMDQHPAKDAASLHLLPSPKRPHPRKALDSERARIAMNRRRGLKILTELTARQVRAEMIGRSNRSRAAPASVSQTLFPRSTTTLFDTDRGSSDPPAGGRPEGLIRSQTARYSLLSFKPASKVKISIVAAKNLPVADRDSSDPFCMCEIVNSGRLKYQTKVVPRSLNPQWNENCELAYSEGDKILFSVFDKGIATDELLGSVTLSSEQVDVDGGFKGEVRLRGGITGRRKSVAPDPRRPSVGRFLGPRVPMLTIHAEVLDSDGQPLKRDGNLVDSMKQIFAMSAEQAAQSDKDRSPEISSKQAMDVEPVDSGHLEQLISLLKASVSNLEPELQKTQSSEGGWRRWASLWQDEENEADDAAAASRAASSEFFKPAPS
eukprot:CAMPEP_0170573922 /NCGR_PEP_ID=MMETSP0224-20130122/3024_1 /TAXON_ID=285029 /ORGANISM="Togula jolla, Strain CCCM 725" /LENGTH=539 /DNA_ID=CAMNT_0010896543 /DNA_START=1 /DNA_END=1620 /DNA_ORIENTATION=+